MTGREVLSAVFDLWNSQSRMIGERQLVLDAKEGKAILTLYSQNSKLNVSSGCMSTTFNVPLLRVEKYESEYLGEYLTLKDGEKEVNIWKGKK